jgi:hypothetical protein
MTMFGFFDTQQVMNRGQVVMVNAETVLYQPCEPCAPGPLALEEL